MDIHVNSDGKLAHTTITGPDGVQFRCVRAISIHIDAKKLLAEAHVTFVLPVIDVSGRVHMFRKHANEILLVADAIRAGKVELVGE